MKEYVYANCTMKFDKELEVWEVFDWDGNKLFEEVGIKAVQDTLREMKLTKQGPFSKPKPPIGVVPKHIWEMQRFHALKAAMRRYVDAGFPIPAEWKKEYAQLHLKGKGYVD